jgi:hypothetical protein
MLYDPGSAGWDNPIMSQPVVTSTINSVSSTPMNSNFEAQSLQPFGLRPARLSVYA